MVADTSWEFCELGLVQWKDHGGRGWSEHTYVRYYAPDGSDLYQQLAELDRPISFNAFSRAMGLLGAGGWELVSVQHGNCYGGEMAYNQCGLIWNNRVAYFKRPVVAGRAVNEPALLF
jgi:hypothetical protein